LPSRFEIDRRSATWSCEVSVGNGHFIGKQLCVPHQHTQFSGSNALRFPCGPLSDALRLDAQPLLTASKMAVVPACTAFASRLLAAETTWTAFSMSISSARVAPPDRALGRANVANDYEYQAKSDQVCRLKHPAYSRRMRSFAPDQRFRPPEKSFYTGQYSD
jgi:hypothetical protein